MTLGNYMKDKEMLLLLQAGCMGGSFCYLKICGLNTGQLLLFYIVWIFILFVWLMTDWIRRKSFFAAAEELLLGLDKPYLLGEVMTDSVKLEDNLYKDMIRRSNKSVIDAVHLAETERTEYKEFIESWIHEVKLPITAINLICDNHKSEEMRKIKRQLLSLENDVDKALFYARSDTVYQDYLIREISLRETLLKTISRNKQYFIENQVQMEVECGEEVVFCDDKWLEFIFNQLLINAVKYKKEKCLIHIHSEKREKDTLLIIRDNGLGIKESEIDRIFDKGFTGTNGRQTKQSTGIGLYLCKKLCVKLGITISVTSAAGVYTEILLQFPDGSTFFSR